MGQTDKRIYFGNLDLLRFIAAYMVVILHAYFGWKTHFNGVKELRTIGSKGIELLERVISNFTIGVDIFF